MKNTQPAPRYAVSRFENLSGDSSLDWVGLAVSEVLAQSLAGALDGPMLGEQSLNRAGLALGPAPPARAKAEAAGVTRLISGYLERAAAGQLRLSATEEDLVTHKSLRILSAEAAQPMAATLQLAHSFAPSAHPYETSKPDALRLYATAVEELPDRAQADLHQALALDPHYGRAWVALIDADGLRGDRTASLDAANQALSQKLDPADQAAVRLQKAVLEKDKPARLAALRDLSTATSGDLILARTLAEAENAAGSFKLAAAQWNKIRQVAPNDQDSWNQSGYSLAWSGDYADAMAAMKEYAARWPSDPNPLDSTGDVEFMYGKFASAAAWYLKANEKNPQFLSGGELYKAAWAWFRAGDKTKADASFALFQKARDKSGATSRAQFEGDWLYRTGREKEGMEAVRMEATTSTQPATTSPLWAQLVIWDLMAKDRAGAAKDAAVEATKPPSALSSVVRFAALPSASPAEWQSRADSLLRGPGAENVRRFALGVALLLDGKKDAARPVWDKIADDSSATDFFTRAMDAKLKGEKPRFELVPDSQTVNELRSLEDRL